MLLGEAAGRVRIPLSGLPDGVIAVTVPRKDPEGEVSVPVDRKGRPAWRKADLVAEQPAQAFTPPAELSASELAWFLETKDYRRWQAIQTKFADRAWSLVTALIRDGGAVVRVSVSDIKSWEPRTLRLTHAWAGQAVDLLREMRGQPVPGEARAALLEIMAGVPEFSDEANPAPNGIRAGQRGLTRAERAGCKTVGYAFDGSNPSHLPPPAKTVR